VFITKNEHCFNYKNKNMETIIQTAKSSLTVQPFPDATLIDLCVAEVADKMITRPEIMLYGKIVHQNRDVAFFSDTSIGYRYSGKLAASQHLNTLPSMTKLLETINNMYDASYNGILVNRYIDGNNYISAHSDDESGLDKSGVVAISYGVVRKFRIRSKLTKKIVSDILTKSGMVMCMSGDFQKEFTHEIPVEKRIKGIRYSFTFRHHLV
jgi:alkylated DNA repair dioxygenase AlkB